MKKVYGPLVKNIESDSGDIACDTPGQTTCRATRQEMRANKELQYLNCATCISLLKKKTLN